MQKPCARHSSAPTGAKRAPRHVLGCGDPKEQGQLANQAAPGWKTISERGNCKAAFVLWRSKRAVLGFTSNSLIFPVSQDFDEKAIVRKSFIY